MNMSRRLLLMPIGAMPKGAAWRSPNSVVSVVRRETSTTLRGMKPSSSKAARLSCVARPSSTPPLT